MDATRNLDLAVVAVYLLGTLALGAGFLRRSNTAEGFTVGSRSIPTWFQRYHAAKSEEDAKRSIVIAALPYIPTTALFLAIGTALFAFYRVFPELLPAGVSGDRVFPIHGNPVAGGTGGPGRSRDHGRGDEHREFQNRTWIHC